MTTIRVSLRALKAALHVAGKQDVRYYLNGILIEAGTSVTRITGCDGSALATMREAQNNGVPYGEVRELIVPRHIIEGVKATAKQLRDGIVQIELPEDTRSEDCVLRFEQITMTFRAVDGRFPDYRRVIPQVGKQSGAPVAFNIDLLTLMGKCIDTFTGSPKYPAIRLDTNGEEGAALVRTSDGSFVGVLMPLRKEPCDHDILWAQESPKCEDAPMKEAA